MLTARDFQIIVNDYLRTPEGAADVQAGRALQVDPAALDAVLVAGKRPGDFAAVLLDDAVHGRAPITICPPGTIAPRRGF